MEIDGLVRTARISAGLSQGTLAAAAGTSRPTLSAYENGRKSPTLDTAARILAKTGFTLALVPRVEFREVAVERGRPIQVPTALPRLPLAQALARVKLPLHLNWSDRDRSFDLRERRERARLYEVVLREGTPQDVLTYVDGALLIDAWGDLVLPVAVRDAWEPLVRSAIGSEVA